MLLVEETLISRALKDAGARGKICASCKRFPSLEKNWEQAQLLYLQGTSNAKIAEIIGCKRGTLEARISRAGLPAIRERMLQEGRAERTKQKIAACTETIVDQLSAKTPKSTGALNRHADTLQKAAKTAALVHGWGENPLVPIIVAGDITGRFEELEEPPVDIEEVGPEPGSA